MISRWISYSLFYDVSGQYRWCKNNPARFWETCCFTRPAALALKCEFLPIFPWYSLCAEWLPCVISELSSCRHHPVVRSLPSWLVLEGRWVASWLSLCPSLSVSLPLSHFSFGNSLWFRCKRYNFRHSLIRKASKRHCNEYWNVFHETAIVNNWCLCLFFLYKSSCILKTAA